MVPLPRTTVWTVAWGVLLASVILTAIYAVLWVFVGMLFLGSMASALSSVHP